MVSFNLSYINVTMIILIIVSLFGIFYSIFIYKNNHVTVEAVIADNPACRTLQLPDTKIIPGIVPVKFTYNNKEETSYIQLHNNCDDYKIGDNISVTFDPQDITNTIIKSTDDDKGRFVFSSVFICITIGVITIFSNMNASPSSISETPTMVSSPIQSSLVTPTQLPANQSTVTPGSSSAFGKVVDSLRCL
jgi:hypothetical protein